MPEPGRRRWAGGVLAATSSSSLALVALVLVIVAPTVALTLAAQSVLAPGAPEGGDPAAASAPADPASPFGVPPPPAGPGAPSRPGGPPPGPPPPADGPRADLVAAVRSDPPVPTAGRPITYVAGVTSRGPAPTGRTTLVLTLPPVTDVRATTGADDLTCDTDRNRLTCTGPGLAPGEGREVTVTALVGEAAGLGPAAATVAVSSDLPDPVPGDDVATTAPRGQREADLVVDAPSPEGPLVAGEPVTLGASVTNRGPSIAESTVVTAVLPPGVRFGSGTVPGGTCGAVGGEVTCTLPRPLPPGETTDVAVQAVLDPAFDGPGDAGDAGELVASVSAVSATPDPEPADGPVVTRTPVETRAGLDVVTQVPSAVTAGTEATYTVVVTNRGPSDARDVELDVGDDVLAALDVDASAGTCRGEGTTRTCALGTVPSGSSTRVRVLAAVPPDAPAGPVTPATELRTTTGAGPDPAVPPPAAATVVGRPSDLAVAIDTARDTGLVGLATTYTITVRNLGPAASVPSVLTATIPPGLTTGDVGPGCVASAGQVSCAVEGLPVGGAASTTIATGVTPGLLVSPQPVSARVTIPGPRDDGAGDPQPANDTAVAAVGDRDGADLAVTAAADPAPVPAGTRTARVVTVRNRGPAPARDVVLTDLAGPGLVPVDLPPGCTAVLGAVSCALDILDAGDARTVRIPVDVTANAATGPVTSTATVRAAAPVDPSDTNATAATVTTIGAVADLRTELAPVVDEPVLAGGPPVTYRVLATNAGPSAAAGAVVSVDAAPRGTTVVGAVVGGIPCTVVTTRAVCALGDLPPGAPVEALVSVATAGDRLPDTAPLLTATASSLALDPTPDDADAAVAGRPASSADLRASAALDPATAPDGAPVAGSRVGLRVGAASVGPSLAADTTFSTTLPPGAGVVSAVPTRGSCTVTGTRVDCAAGDLPAGGTAAATLVVEIPADARGTFEARTTVESPTPDPTGADRVAVLAAPIAAPASGPTAAASAGEAPGVRPVATLDRLGPPGVLTLAAVLATVVAGALVATAVARRREDGSGTR